MQIDLNKYTDFVREVTSDNSNYTDKLVDTLEQIEANKTINIALLLTSAIGLATETGEFAEIGRASCRERV